MPNSSLSVQSLCTSRTSQSEDLPDQSTTAPGQSENLPDESAPREELSRTMQNMVDQVAELVAVQSLTSQSEPNPSQSEKIPHESWYVGVCPKPVRTTNTQPGLVSGQRVTSSATRYLKTPRATPQESNEVMLWRALTYCLTRHHST